MTKNNTKTIYLKSSNGGLSVGGDSHVRVNCNVGANTAGQMAYERERLASIRENGLLPDCFMDLSIGSSGSSLLVRGRLPDLSLSVI